MKTHVLEYLDEVVTRCPDKMAYSNGTDSLSFKEVNQHAKSVGSSLLRMGVYKEPVVVFMEKHPNTIATFFGVNASGNYYIPIDIEMPEIRIKLILDNVKAKVMICDDTTTEFAKRFDFEGQIVSYKDICDTEIDEDKLLEVREKALDTDPIYIVFTSGSTGIPKGVVACHRSVIDYIESLCATLKFDENTVFGSQTPLYVDACLKEIYPTLKYGASAYLIPKEYFMFPVKLVEFMNEYKVNTICWVVSALTMISAFNTFKTVTPKYLRLIAFASEVFPIKQFNKWKEVLPDCRFINLYGPTEATGISCYYEVDREFAEDEVIPIGKPFKNTEIILLKDDLTEAKDGEEGEICIRGTSLTLGYYNNFEKTNEVFVQNPLNSLYPEKIYKTGDIGKYNKYGELEFVSRKDHQIKHMGHRIELGEIEVNVNLHEDIQMAACIYDDIKNRIVLYYVGSIEEKDLAVFLKEKLPRYMIPNNILKIDQIPLTMNGKVDRVLLKKNYQEMKKK